MRGVREDRQPVGASAHVPNLRRYSVLRQFAQPPRHQARPCQRPSRHRFRSTRGTLALLLQRRSFRALLVDPEEPPRVFDGLRIAQELERDLAAGRLLHDNF